MKPFINEDFLLNSEFAKKLYHDYAKEMPIYDYHCHLSPKELYENKGYEDITEVWLGGDHYKWRAMRTNGVEEKFITGDAPSKEKFKMWAKTMEYAIGNPLFHWTHLELKRYFGIDDLLCEKTSDEIYEKTTALLQEEKYHARGLVLQSNVKVICTTDDPLDELEYHEKLANEKFPTKVLPTFRPDKLIYIERDPYLPYIKSINDMFGVEICTFEMLLEVIEARVEHFKKIGCKLSDHSMEPPVFEKYTLEEVDEIFKKKLNGETLTIKEINKYKTAVMIYLGQTYAKKGFTMQLHIGVTRNKNTYMFNQLGPDTGFDCIDDQNYLLALAKFMDELERDDLLPRTIIYSLNPRDNEMLSSLIGCYQKGPMPGKIQFGSGWWFNDQIDGMTRQMTALMGLSLLPRFVGMLTDSRSFLSYTRHEYFRRILCNMLGEMVERGEAPRDEKWLGRIVKDISYDNAKRYFKINVD